MKTLIVWIGIVALLILAVTAAQMQEFAQAGVYGLIAFALLAIPTGKSAKDKNSRAGHGH